MTLSFNFVNHSFTHALSHSLTHSPSCSLIQVASAVLMWAKDNGASSFCHWFQPLGAAGLRHGQSAQVQSAMMEFQSNGVAKWDFNGKMLLKGETDGSSFPNGGLRVTHSAAAYLALDPSSPIFLREDAIFIPSCMCSYHGHALDEKTPLLRSMDALSTQGARLMNHLGLGKTITGVFPNIGLEQELFFVPTEHFKRRPDLQLAGRTVLGKLPSRGQDGSDHYMAPIAIHHPQWGYTGVHTPLHPLFPLVYVLRTTT